jgi:hypothetical protein
MRSEPELLLKGEDIVIDEDQEGTDRTIIDPPIPEGWDEDWDVHDLPTDNVTQSICPEIVNDGDLVRLPAVSPASSVPPKPNILENKKQARAFKVWLDLHDAGKLSVKEIDKKVAEDLTHSLSIIHEWKARFHWIKRRLEHNSDLEKEKILELINKNEQVESKSLSIIIKYLDKVAESTFPIDRPTIKMMQELITFARSNMDKFQASVFEKRVASLTAGVRLTISE